MKPDLRPALANALAQLSDRPSFGWPGVGRITLTSADRCIFDAPGSLAIIVHRGRFGLARVVSKDGLRAYEIRWLGGGESCGGIYLHGRALRASVTIDEAEVTPCG